MGQGLACSEDFWFPQLERWEPGFLGKEFEVIYKIVTFAAAPANTHTTVFSAQAFVDSSSLVAADARIPNF